MYRKYALIALVIAFAAGLLFASSSLQDTFFLITDRAGDFTAQNMVLVSSVFILLAALSAMISPFSSTPIVPIAVALWGTELATTLLLAGWLIGDGAAYVAGRYAGHPLLEQFFDEEKLRKYEKYFSEHMTFFRALLVRIALPAEIGYGFGLINYNFIKYSVVTIVAETLFAIITVQASDALVSLNPIAFVSWSATLIIIVGGFYYLFRRTHKSKGL